MNSVPFLKDLKCFHRGPFPETEIITELMINQWSIVISAPARKELKCYSDGDK
jgi:hypothetical protein